VIIIVDTYNLISLFFMSGRTFGPKYKNVQTIGPPPPLWADFCLTQRDSFGMLWLITQILYFRSNHWIKNWKNIKHTSPRETSRNMANCRYVWALRLLCSVCTNPSP